MQISSRFYLPLTAIFAIAMTMLLAGCGGSSSEEQLDHIAQNASASIEQLSSAVSAASAHHRNSLVTMQAAASTTSDTLSDSITKLDELNNDDAASLRKSLVSQRALAFALAADRLSAGDIRLASEKAKFVLDSATGPQLPRVDTSGLLRSLESARKSRLGANSNGGTQASPPAQSGGGRVPASGTFSGIATQRSGSNSSRNKDYPVEMTFSAAGSSINYPSLGCSGRLIPQGFKDGRRVYRETITSGHCDDGGSWEVEVVSENKLRVNWTQASTDYIVSATLVR